jgi:hypothetical protein
VWTRTSSSRASGPTSQRARPRRLLLREPSTKCEAGLGAEQAERGTSTPKRRSRFERGSSFVGHGGLGPGDRGDGAVRAPDAGAAVHAAGAGAGGGVREHAHQRPRHPRPRRPLLRAHHHLPRRHRGAHLRRLD